MDFSSTDLHKIRRKNVINLPGYVITLIENDSISKERTKEEMKKITEEITHAISKYGLHAESWEDKEFFDKAIRLMEYRLSEPTI